MTFYFLKDIINYKEEEGEINKLYDGKFIFSIILPVDFQYDNGDVKIKNGILLNSLVDKKIVVTGSDSIFTKSIWLKRYLNSNDDTSYN